MWTNFTSTLLSSYPYKYLTINGTYDSIGLTITNSTVITNIANALRLNTYYMSTSTNGRVWIATMCSSTQELSSYGISCQCPLVGYIVRPCSNNYNFGGINTKTCGGPTQVMTVIFGY